MHCNIGARSIVVDMNPAFLIFSFLVGAFTGGVVLMIAGNKFMTKQLVVEQAKLDAELVRTKERIAAEKRKRLQMSKDRTERVIGYHETLGHV
jgi:hypothetical protein